MNVLVVGANGKVGTLLCGKLWAVHDFSAVALIRDSRQQTKFTALGVPSVNGDLEEGIAEFCRYGRGGLLCWLLGQKPVPRKRLTPIKTQRFA